MEGHGRVQQFQQQQHPYQHSASIHVDVSDRFPQWSLQETKEFLVIRSELDQAFMETKRNKLLWEDIATKMKEKGYNRSADQCKCKWKNLVTRYKGCETMDLETTRQHFPFFHELQSIFGDRMQRMLFAESEGVVASGSAGSKKKGPAVHLSSDEDYNEDSEVEKVMSMSRKKKKKMKSSSIPVGSGSVIRNNLNEILEEFMTQQLQLESKWIEAFESREKERRRMEMEWRHTMETLENERMMMEQNWREREEERRLREEGRAERRDALITALLNKLTR